jgi:hypothetical protein
MQVGRLQDCWCCAAQRAELANVLGAFYCLNCLTKNAAMLQESISNRSERD